VQKVAQPWSPAPTYCSSRTDPRSAQHGQAPGVGTGGFHSLMDAIYFFEALGTLGFSDWVNIGYTSRGLEGLKERGKQHQKTAKHRIDGGVNCGITLTGLIVGPKIKPVERSVLQSTLAWRKRAGWSSRTEWRHGPAPTIWKAILVATEQYNNKGGRARVVLSPTGRGRPNHILNSLLDAAVAGDAVRYEKMKRAAKRSRSGYLQERKVVPVQKDLEDLYEGGFHPTANRTGEKRDLNTRVKGL
jgi:hypothetical protein